MLSPAKWEGLVT